MGSKKLKAKQKQKMQTKTNNNRKKTVRIIQNLERNDQEDNGMKVKGKGRNSKRDRQNLTNLRAI